MSILKHLPNQSFKLTKLVESVAICFRVESDRAQGKNITETESGFWVYLGCSEEEVSGYLKSLNTFYRCEWNEIRKPKYLEGFEVEIKIRNMQRYSDSNYFGLDYLVESESAKHLGCNSEEYEYFTTGYIANW